MIDQDYIYGLKAGQKGGKSDYPATKATKKSTKKYDESGNITEESEEKNDENPWEDDSALLTDNPAAFSGLNLPPEWAWASGMFGDMAENWGHPVDTAGVYDKWMARGETDLQDRIAQAYEDAGMIGQRWGSVLGDDISREVGRFTSEGTWQQAMADIQAREAGRGRMLPSIMGANQIGNQFFNAPMQVSSAMMDNAWKTQQMEQSYLDAERRNAMNPFEQYLAEYLKPGGYEQPTRPPSTGSNFLAGIMPFLENWEDWSSIFG